MSNITDLLFRMGVGTWCTDLITEMPTVAKKEFQIGKTMPTDVGFIYGLAMYADGVDAANIPLISTTQAQNMYVTLQDGPTQFLQTCRLSDLLSEFAGSPVIRPDKFMPVNIPTFDISKSTYQNPLLFTSGILHLRLWYVNMHDWEKVKKNFPFEKQADTVKK